LGGTPIILDIHDIVPEFYESKFSRPGKSVIAAALRRIERTACQFANHVLISNHIWKEILLERSAPPAKVTALINSVDLELFRPTLRTRNDGRLVLIYPGTLNYHQGIDVAINALKTLLDEFPQLELHIYGNGAALQELKNQTTQLRLGEHVRFF